MQTRTSPASAQGDFDLIWQIKMFLIRTTFDIRFCKTKLLVQREQKEKIKRCRRKLEISFRILIRNKTRFVVCNVFTKTFPALKTCPCFKVGDVILYPGNYLLLHQICISRFVTCTIKLVLKRTKLKHELRNEIILITILQLKQKEELKKKGNAYLH